MKKKKKNIDCNISLHHLLATAVFIADKGRSFPSQLPPSFVDV